MKPRKKSRSTISDLDIALRYLAFCGQARDLVASLASMQTPPDMIQERVQPRGSFLRRTAQLGSGLLLVGTGSALISYTARATTAPAQEQEQGEQVSANGDLMREHGIL